MKTGKILSLFLGSLLVATLFSSGAHAVTSSIKTEVSAEGGSEASVHINSTIKSSSSTVIEQDGNTEISVKGNGNVKISVTGGPQPTIHLYNSTSDSNNSDTNDTSPTPSSTPTKVPQAVNDEKNEAVKVKLEKLFGLFPIELAMEKEFSLWEQFLDVLSF